MNDQFNNIITSSGTSNTWAILGAPSFREDKIRFTKKVRSWGIFLKNKITEISVDEFFGAIKKDKLKLKIIKNIFDQYLISIERAEISGQTALAESLRDSIALVKKEVEIVAAGINEYVGEKQFDELRKKSTKGIEVTPIKNFTRHIPDKVIKKIAEVRAKNIFDEFVVVHYDPQQEAIKLTKKEIEKKKDPIVFGKVNGSDKMYFIADWIDEYCNLTMEEVARITGRKASTILKQA